MRNAAQNSLAAMLATAAIQIPAAAAQDMSAADVPAPNVSIPTYPALALLDVDSSKLASVSDTRDLGLQLGNLLDGDGSLNSGVAFGGRPFWWLRPGMTLDQYTNARQLPLSDQAEPGQRPELVRGTRVDNGSTYFTRVLARANLSVATVEADGGTRLGIGLTTQLLDGQDPRYDLDNLACIQGGLAAFAAVEFPLQERIYEQVKEEFLSEYGRPFDESNVDDQPRFQELYADRALAIGVELEVARHLATAGTQSAAVYAGCADAMKQRFAESQAWTVGIGSTFQTSGQLTDLDQEQVALWSAYSFPINRQIAADQTVNLGSATFFVRQNIDQTVDAPGGGGETEADSLEVAFLLATSEENRWRLDAHYTHIEREYHDAMFTDESFQRYGLGLQYRITEAFAIEVSGGAITGSAMDDGDFLNIEFKLDWAKLGLLGG